MLNRANVLKIAYICPNRDIMLNRTGEEKPKPDIEQIKSDRDKIVKSTQTVKK